jgi:hypothetical protein
MHYKWDLDGIPLDTLNLLLPEALIYYTFVSETWANPKTDTINGALGQMGGIWVQLIASHVC